MEFHLVSNGRMDLDEFSKIAGRVAPYVDFIHIREKDRSAQDITRAIKKLKEESISSENIIVNDRVDIACVEGVRGVQLAYHSIGSKEVRKHFSQLRIGKSVHSVWEAQEAETDGADYVLFGHIFPSNSKPGLMSKGIEALKDVVDAISIPVIAIGGIKRGCRYVGSIRCLRPFSSGSRISERMVYMTIQVNGKQIDLPQTVNHISDLLNHYNLQSNQVIVELNQTIVDQKLHADTQIQNGDQVELVHFVGGG